jgi:gluconate 2-dehydrogenase gamma chain
MTETSRRALFKATGAHSPFAKMSPDDQDSYLKNLEARGKDLGGVPSDVVFTHLWDSTLEGFFVDPVYGGNLQYGVLADDRVSGRYASYYDLVDQHGIKLDRAPMSLAEDDPARALEPHRGPQIPPHNHT